MPGALYQYLADDHSRLDKHLHDALSKPDTIDTTAYAQFRNGLLRHIGIEEKLLLPAVLRALENPPSIIPQIKLDHAALVALLVPPPTPAIIAALRAILAKHNDLEEQGGGLYEVIEGLPPDEVDDLLHKARSAAEVRVLPHNAGPHILEATRRALARAGYNLTDYETG